MWWKIDKICPKNAYFVGFLQKIHHRNVKMVQQLQSRCQWGFLRLISS